MGINYGLNKVRFPAPVPVGSRVRGRFTVASIEEIEGGIQVVANGLGEREGAGEARLRRRARLPAVPLVDVLKLLEQFSSFGRRKKSGNTLNRPS